MRFPHNILFSLILLLIVGRLSAQMTTISGAPYTPESLIETIFLGDGVEVLSITYEGDEGAIGFFDNATAELGMESGVILTTGSAAEASNPGNFFASNPVNNPAPPNGDLQSLLVNPALSIENEIRYTIRFIPFSDTLRFNFAFGSEEYPEFVCDIFNDVFGFFISGPGINGPFSDNAENIALIPETNFPVAINFINGGVSSAGGDPQNCTLPNGSLDFSQFYIDNDGSNTGPVYDGYTRIFTAEAIVEPCQEYTIKLAIADAGDGAYDSGVFLEAKSFGGSDFDLELTDLALDGTLAEGCRPANLIFTVANVSNEDRVLPLSYLGTATMGVDYSQLPDSIFIPAGEDSVVFVVQAFEDDLVEGIEDIRIVFQRNICRTDTLDIKITDNLLVPAMLPDSIEFCPGDTLNLDATLPVVFPDPPRFESNGTVTIGIPPDEYSSFINVNNVQPEELQAGIIKSICIDSFTHQWISDLDLFLIGPNGQVLELTTDNGADGGNFFGEDAYIRTCFTPTAVNPITGPGNTAPASFVPFTGEWQPEGDWNILFDGDYQTNGAWELRILDDSNFGTGTLWSWSICLEPIYQIEYQWDTIPGLSCLDCPVTDYFGEDPTRLRVVATDSYGCQIRDSVELVYEQLNPSPEPSCEAVTDSSITFSWDPVPGSMGYDVRLDDRGYLNVGNNLTHTFTGLLPDTDYEISVRAVFFPCPSPPARIICTTGPCLPPTLSALATDLTCFGADDGTVSTQSASGGRNPYVYTLNDIILTGPDSSGLAPGDYFLAITDTVGCADTVQLSVGEPAAITPAITALQPISCNGANDGVLVASLSGGVGPYSYSWNGVVGTDTLSNAAPGDYVLEITDANDCTESRTITIGEPSVLGGAVQNVTTQNCEGPPDGTIATNATGGTPPYTYAWSDPSIGDVANPTGLTAGDYTATVTDESGCFFTLTATVGLEPAVDLSGSTVDILCNGAATGSISTNVNVGQAPFSYAWSGPVELPDIDSPNNLIAGDYTLLVTDGRGCLDTLNFSLTQPDTILGSAVVTEINCVDVNSGALDWTGFGGVTPYTYDWSNGAATQDLDGLPFGTYELTVTDANGCQIEQSYVVPERTPIVVETIVDSVSCFGGSDGGVFGRLENAVPPFRVNWVRVGTTDSVADLSLRDVVAGTYRMIGLDADQCPIDRTIVIPEPPQLRLDALVENVRCAGEGNGLIELAASGGRPAYQYRLGRGDYRSSNVFINLEAGVRQAEVRDANGCLTTLENIEIIEPDPLTLDLGDDLVIIWGDSIQLIPNVQGGGGVIANYQWLAFDSTLLNCYDCAIVYAKPNEQTTIRLRITDDYGCTVEDFVTLFVEKDFPVEVPTAFTPNGDSNNDRLIVHGLPGTEVLRFQVYNRWGGLVYERENFPVNDENFGWNGEFRDEPAAGTFVWQVTARLPDGTEKSYSGQTTLIR